MVIKLKSQKKIAIAIAGLALLSSCEKDKNEVSISQSEEVSVNAGILTFKNDSVYRKTISSLQEMDVQERNIWANKLSFKSLGVESDNFYFNIDESQFSNIEELLEFVKNNSDKIAVYEDLENADSLNPFSKYVFEPIEYSNPERYILNSDRIFAVADTVYRQVGQNLISAHIKDLPSLRNFEDAEIKDFPQNELSLKNVSFGKGLNKSEVTEYGYVYENGYQKYRLTATVETFIKNRLYDIFNHREVLQIAKLTIKNHSRGLFGWWIMEKSNTDFDVKVTINNAELYGDKIIKFNSPHFKGKTFSSSYSTEIVDGTFVEIYPSAILPTAPTINSVSMNLSNWKGCRISVN